MSSAITSFETLVQAAKNEPQPQRMLFLFLKTILPSEATSEEQGRFKEGQGGGLQPLFSVDSAPADLSTFDNLVAESEQMAAEWQIVLIGCLGGQGGEPPSSEEAQQWLKVMQQTVENGGNLAQFVAFNRSGEPVMFHSANRH